MGGVLVLPPRNRLRRTKEFRGIVRRGVRIGRPLLVVHAVPGVDAVAPPRAGFVVGRPVGDAVVRNLVRRRLRHLVRDRIEHLPPGTNVVIRARPDAARASRQALARDLDDALTRALAAGRSASTLRGARP